MDHNKYVIQDKSGKVLFRFQTRSFAATKSPQNFIYPIPKLVIVTDGEAIWEIGKTPFDVKKGDIIILRPRTIRHFEEMKSEEPLTVEMYEFLPEFLCGMPCFNLFVTESNMGNTVLYHAHPENEQIRDIFTQIKYELEYKRSMGSDIIRGLMICGFSKLIRAFDMKLDMSIIHTFDKNIPLYDFEYTATGDTHPLSSTDHSISMTYVLNMILSNISGEISIDELAEAAHMSRSHFFKVFRKYNGMSVNDYILKRRVENTVKLLIESNCTVLDAAYASGFTSSSGFYKAFHKITGKTPKDYLSDIKTNWDPGNEP